MMALLPLNPDSCPDCGSEAIGWTWHESDADGAVVVECVDCGWHILRARAVPA